MTTLVTDFESQRGLLMACFIAMTSGTFLETIVVQSLMNKRLIAPIKEICNGAGQASRAIGVLMITGLGGLVSIINVNAPFFMVGMFDMLIVVAVTVLYLSKSLNE